MCNESIYLNDEEEKNCIEEEEREKEQIDVSKLLDSNISKCLVSMSFDTVVQKFNNFDFTLPKYQRKYVWSQEQVANLALSMIKNIPIPPIYVYEDEETANHIILDGQQRVISLFLYYNGLTIKNNKKNLVDFYEILNEHKMSDKTFIEIIKEDEEKFIKKPYLVGEKNEIDITYDNLGKVEKRKLGGRFLDVVFLNVKDDEKETVYSNIVNLLNSAGTPLTKQEIRNGVYQSKLYDMIHNLNNTDTTWRRLFGAKHPKSKDIELLLRLLAIEYYTKVINDNGKERIEFINDDENNSIYKGSYNLLLDKYSQCATKFSEEYVEELRINLIEFFKKFNLDDNKELQNNGNKTINHLLLEALYVSYIKKNKKITSIDSNLIKLIKSDDSYKETIKTSTCNKANIEKRLSSIYRNLKNA